MSAATDAIERRLTDVGRSLRSLREELRVTEEELAHFAHEAQDAGVRELVSEDRMARREADAARRTVSAVTRQRDHLTAEIARLEASQDDLLDQLSAAQRQAQGPA